METPSTPPPPGEPNLAPEHYRAVEVARRRRRSIARAANVASFNGWCAVVLAVLSLPFILLEPIVGLVVLIVLIVVASLEFKGRAMLRRLDPRGAVLLGGNQLGLMTIVIVYCLWRILAELVAPTSIDRRLLDALLPPEVLGEDELERFVDMITVVTYSAVILATALFQGFNALYYFSRGRIIRTYRHETPEWVLRLDRTP